MNTGYIKLYRKIEDSIVWTNSDMLKLWILCLTKAAHSERKFLFNGQELHLKVGEFVTGRDSLAEDFNKGVKPKEKANARTLWRYIKKFEKLEMLSIKPTTKYSVISIKNWHGYQQSDHRVSSACPSGVQHLSTNKNDKNDKNDKTPRKKRTYEEDSVEYLLAKQLFDRIKENNPEHKEPNLQKWANDVRLMIERDNRVPEKISGMIDWSQQDDFWSTNILSTSSLRRNYDKMNAKAAKDFRTKETRKTKREDGQAWKKEIEEMMK